MTLMEYIPMGMPVGNLKRKWELNTIIKPAVEGSIKNAIDNNSSELAINLEKGISANPIKMAETLSEDIVQLSIADQRKMFENVSKMSKNEAITGAMKNVQAKLAQVNSLYRAPLESSLDKIFQMAKENGFNLKQLIIK